MSKQIFLNFFCILICMPRLLVKIEKFKLRNMCYPMDSIKCMCQLTPNTHLKMITFSSLMFESDHLKPNLTYLLLYSLSSEFIMISICLVKRWLGAFIGYHISLYDNKSVSHCIMFDYFVHVWKVNIFSF